jgi:hypothetical protein
MNRLSEKPTARSSTTRARIAKWAANRSCPASQYDADARHVLPKHVESIDIYRGGG